MALSAAGSGRSILRTVVAAPAVRKLLRADPAVQKQTPDKSKSSKSQDKDQAESNQAATNAKNQAKIQARNQD